MIAASCLIVSFFEKRCWTQIRCKKKKLQWDPFSGNQSILLDTNVKEDNCYRFSLGHQYGHFKSHGQIDQAKWKSRFARTNFTHVTIPAFLVIFLTGSRNQAHFIMIMCFDLLYFCNVAKLHMVFIHHKTWILVLFEMIYSVIKYTRQLSAFK